MDTYHVRDYFSKRQESLPDYKANPEEHYRNKGRADLFDLELGAMFIVSATIQSSRMSRREDRTLFTLIDVEVREFRQDIAFDDLPIIARADHVHSSTPTRNLVHLKLDKHPRQVFLGKLINYQTTKISRSLTVSEEDALERRTFELARDIRVNGTLKDLEARFRRFLSRMEAISPEEREAWVGASIKKIDRFESEALNYVYVPWISKPELLKRIQRLKSSLKDIEIMV